VCFAVNRRLQLFFDSFDSTRKVANLQDNPRIASVIGGCAREDERTVQYEGVVDAPARAQLEHFKGDYFNVHPDGLRRSQLPGIRHFRVSPVWIRYPDLNVKPPQIVEFECALQVPGDLVVQAPGGLAREQAPVRPYSGVEEPWQSDIERDRMFNPFASTQARTLGRG
jgi:hypothetical protein